MVHRPVIFMHHAIINQLSQMSLLLHMINVEYLMNCGLLSCIKWTYNQFTFQQLCNSINDESTHPFSVDSHHKATVMRKVFSCHATSITRINRLAEGLFKYIFKKCYRMEMVELWFTRNIILSPSQFNISEPQNLGTHYRDKIQSLD